MHALCALISARIALSVLSFQRLSTLFDGIQSEASHRAGTDETRRRIARVVARASERMPGASCLVQALATRALLAHAGIDGIVRIGVRRSERGRIEAHAWVESGGRILVGGPHTAFTPLVP